MLARTGAAPVHRYGMAERMYRLCCLTKNKTNPAYIGAQIGARRMAESLGCALGGYAPDEPDDIDEQAALLEAALETKPDAVLITPVHATALNQQLGKVVDAGIPLIFFVTSAAGAAGSSFVTSNSHTLAMAIADHLFGHLSDAERIVMIEGLPQSPTTAPRTEGFLEAAGARPGIEIVARFVGDYQRDAARDGMVRILQQQPQIDGVLAANDVMALDALDRAGRKAAVVGMNALPEAIRAIKARRLLATVSYDAFSLACVAVQAAVRILKGEAVPAEIELPAEIIDSENCEVWDLPYDQRPLPEWETITSGRA